MSALRLHASTSVVLTLAIAGCDGAESPPPVEGTWGVARELQRKLDRRSQIHGARARALTLRFERARKRHRKLVAQLHDAVVSRVANLEAADPT